MTILKIYPNHIDNMNDTIFFSELFLLTTDYFLYFSLFI